MGVALKDLIVSRDVDFDFLKGRILAVDSYNQLYQFLTTIRSQDGSPLKDSKGNITSHLAGLISRNSTFALKGLKLAFVFDGPPPKLKYAEIERRMKIKGEAQKLYDQAVADEDVDGMKKFASRTAKLTKDMVEESKLLISAMGFPVVQAPSEADAQIAYLARNGDAFACVSQDFDSLLHASPKIVRNLSIAGRRKKSNALAYDVISPQIINLDETLKSLGISQKQLVALGIIVGTDYNPGGVKGIGPKKALTAVKQHGENFDSLFSSLDFDKHSSVSWNEIFDLITNMPVNSSYVLKWGNVNKDEVFRILCDEHDFSKDRVARLVDDLQKCYKQNSQTGLGSFF